MIEELKVSREVEEVDSVAEVVDKVTDHKLVAVEEVAVEEVMDKSVKEAVVVEVEEVAVVEEKEVVKMVMANLTDIKERLVKMLIQWIDKMVLAEEEEASRKEVMEKPTGELIKMLPKMALRRLKMTLKTTLKTLLKTRLLLKKKRKMTLKFLSTKSQRLPL